MWWCEVDKDQYHFIHCCSRMDNDQLKWHKRDGHDACGPKNPRNQIIALTGSFEIHQWHMALLKKKAKGYV